MTKNENWKNNMKDRFKEWLYWKLLKFMSWAYPCHYCNGKGCVGPDPSSDDWGPQDCDMCSCSGINLEF